MDLKESVLLGDSADGHWYYRSKSAALRRYIKHLDPIRVLDVGAGSGVFTRYLLRSQLTSLGICVDTGYAVDRDEQYFGKSLRFRRACGSIDVDLVLLMDVLEHVDDDSALLATYASKVRAGTPFLITVPAFQWLWSDHDVFLEHRRRYNIQQLEHAVRKAGLTVDQSSYFFAFVLPIAAVIRWFKSSDQKLQRHPQSQLRRHNRITNSLLTRICCAELPLLRANRIGGLSVFCLAHTA